MIKLSKEDITLIKQLRRPQFFIHAIYYWTKIVARALLKRVSNILGINTHMFYYPSYLTRGCVRIDPKRLNFFDQGFMKRLSSMSEPLSEMRETAVLKTPVTIELATQKLPCNGTPDWQQEFDDQEDTFVLHRWGWLLMLGASNPSAEIKQWGIEVMQDWFLKMKSKKDHPSWESYSVSERIVNAILFIYALRDFSCNETDYYNYIEKELINMGIHLMGHLEFRGEMTNNHVLNNARALYMLGRLSRCEELANTGRLIFIKETPNMITPSGFLREGSSHYHLVILRTYLEVFWLAELTKDDTFVEVLKPVVKSMVKVASFFSIYNKKEHSVDIPLIGDVSPDFPPEWLSSICMSEPALRLHKPFDKNYHLNVGWNGIWQTEKQANSNLPYEVERHGYRSRFYNESGWYRVDIGYFTAFWFVYPYGAAPFYSHGHNDTGSFVLYWKGIQVITDPGRLSYVAEPLSLYGKMAEAHNTFTVDGFGPFPVMKYLYPEKYGKGLASVDWKEEAEGYRFKILHDGFRRIGKQLIASREFFITRDSIEITDAISGTGKHDVKTFFHFGRDIEISNCSRKERKATFKIDDGNIDLKYNITGESKVKVISGQISSEPIGWYFPKYGRSISINTLVIDVEAAFPYKACYSLKFKG